MAFRAFSSVPLVKPETTKSVGCCFFYFGMRIRHIGPCGTLSMVTCSINNEATRPPSMDFRIALKTIICILTATDLSQEHRETVPDRLSIHQPPKPPHRHAFRLIRPAVVRLVSHRTLFRTLSSARKNVGGPSGTVHNFQPVPHVPPLLSLAITSRSRRWSTHSPQSISA
jgi:hypothetical protein